MRNLLLTAMAAIMFFSCKKEINQVQLKNGNLSSATTSGKRIYFSSPNNFVDQNFDYSPGDTFVLTSGVDYTYFTMSNLNNVTIINDGGVVHLQNGFSLTGCTNVTITGTGTNDFYGFEISGHTPGDVGVDINGKSSHITCNNIYVHTKTYGFWVKQEVEATCDQSLYYPNWYLDSVEISNCKIQDVDQEGMYLGSTGQNADRPNSCGEFPYPMRISNIYIHNNIVDSTGRGGIMLSGADKGRNRICNNVITRCGYEYNSYQGNGIAIGGNSYANVDSNIIKNTLCDGIWVLGTGTTRVRFNQIDSSGWLDGVYAGNMHGISFDARPSYPFALSTFRIRENTIGNHTDNADIYIYNSPVIVNGQPISGFDTTGNLIYDNNNGNAIVTVQNGIVYSTIFNQ